MKDLEKTILAIGLIKCSICFAGAFLIGLATSRYLIWSTVTLCLIAMIAYRSYQDRTIYIPSPTIFVSMIGFFVVAAISTRFSINKPLSIYQLCVIFNMICFLFAATIVLKEDKDFIVKVAVLIAFGLAVYGIYQCRNTTDMMDRKGTMGFKNLWAFAHLMLLPMCLYSITKLSKWWKALGSITAILLLVNIFLPPVTRSVVLALTAGAILGVFFLKVPYKSHRFWILALILSLQITYLARNRVDYIEFYSKVDYFRYLFSSSSMNERTVIWSSVINMIRENPYGVGIGNWVLNSPLYLNGTVGVDWAYTVLNPSRPHNEFLGAMAETGTIGGVFFASIFLTALYCAWRKQDFVVFIGIIFFMVPAFFSFPSERVFHPMILMIYLAMLIDYKRVQTSKVWIGLASIIVLSGMSFVVFDFYKQHETNAYISRIQYKRTVGDWNGVIDELDNYSWFCQLGPLMEPVETYRAEAYLALGDDVNSMECYKSALEVNPRHYPSMNNLGGLYARKGELKKAEEVFNGILELWPNNEKIKNNLAKVLE